MRTRILSLIMLMALSFSISAQNLGDIAPNFSLTDLNGNTVTLNQYKGKVVALFIFGFSCAPCMAVAPDVETLIHKYYINDDNFVILGLDQWDGNKAAVESFKLKTGVTFPLLQNASTTASLYNSTWDRIIVIDREGKIAHKGSKQVSLDLDAIISTIDGLMTVNSVNEIEDKLSIEVYPNPVVSILHIKLKSVDNEKIEVSLRSIDGKTIRSVNNTHTSDSHITYSINLDGVASGIYFANVKIGDREQTFKIVKQE